MTSHSSHTHGLELHNAGQFYINGEWTSPAVSALLPVVNPATEEVVAEVARGSAEDVDRAVAAARAAFPGWSVTHP
jgi:aldehyde dehydrogenase (NAD+)